MSGEIGRRAFLVAAGAGVSGAGATAASAGRAGSVAADVDVLVVGGGPSGIAAALAAARTGAGTLLIENHAFFGGIASFGLGMPMYQMRPGGEPRSAIHELVLEKLLKYGDVAVRLGRHQATCNVDYLKVAVLDALDEAGCRYLVHAQAVDTVVEENRAVGVVAGTKEGLRTIRAKAIVDCTGDCDVAYFAGAETMKETGSLAPMTLHLQVTNVDMARARAVSILSMARKAREKYPLIPSHWVLSRSPSSNTFYINHAGTRDLGQFDGTDPEQLTRAECVGRRQAVQMVHAMREFGGEGLKDVELIGTGMQIGVRETRRVKGVYVITFEDAKTGQTFDDVIACRFGRLDLAFTRNEAIKVHDVPYRALLPEKLDGLLVAGRCISTTHLAAAAAKDMGNCIATGHAAGLAAALSARNGVVPRALDVVAVQDALRGDDVDLTRGGEVQDVSPVPFQPGVSAEGAA